MGGMDADGATDPANGQAVSPTATACLASLRALLANPELRVKSSSLETIKPIGSGAFAVLELCWLTGPAPGSTEQQQQPGSGAVGGTPGAAAGPGPGPGFSPVLSSRTKVAVKRFRRETLADDERLRLTLNEIRLMMQVKHRHINGMVGIGADDDSSDEGIRSTLFMVLEYQPGGSLRNVVAEQMVDWNAYGLCTVDILHWCSQLASALAYLHSLSPPIVHRDVKLDNLLLSSALKATPFGASHRRSEDGPRPAQGAVDLHAEIRLIDFGLARQLPSDTQLVHGQQLSVPARSAHENQWTRGLSSLHSVHGGSAFGGGGSTHHTSKHGRSSHKGNGVLYETSQRFSHAVQSLFEGSQHRATTAGAVQGNSADRERNSGSSHKRSGTPPADGTQHNPSLRGSGSLHKRPAGAGAVQGGSTGTSGLYSVPSTSLYKPLYDQQQYSGTSGAVGGKGTVQPHHGGGASLRLMTATAESDDGDGEGGGNGEESRQHGAKGAAGQLGTGEDASVRGATGTGRVELELGPATASPQGGGGAGPLLRKISGALSSMGLGGRMATLRGAAAAPVPGYVGSPSSHHRHAAGGGALAVAAAAAADSDAGSPAQSQAEGAGASQHRRSTAPAVAGADAAAAAAAPRPLPRPSLAAAAGPPSGRGGGGGGAAGSPRGPPPSSSGGLRELLGKQQDGSVKLGKGDASVRRSADPSIRKGSGSRHHPALLGALASGPQLHALHHLTGKTGSLMTMAPEVFDGRPYNHKADVFSFAVTAYELLHRQSVLVTVLQRHMHEGREARDAAVREYAAAVAAGYRPPLSPHLPRRARELIERCWDADPAVRPSMGTVAESLLEIARGEDLSGMDAFHGPGAGGCASCCVVS